MAVDPYTVLGVDAGATDAEVRDAYLRRSKQLHPDRLIDATDDERDAATRAMQDLTAAYDAIRHGYEPPRPPEPAPRVYEHAPASTATRPLSRRRLRWPLVALTVFIVGTVLGLINGAGPATPPPPRPGDDLSVLNGECITLKADRSLDDVVDCTRPHDARVVQVVVHGEACPLWSDATMPSAKQDLCLDTV